uniref:Uncharacterized protein n=1 Tax=Pristionchus pacificus TaxID=54126 RepID=A0A8R1UUG1_PRIPA
MHVKGLVCCAPPEQTRSARANDPYPIMSLLQYPIYHCPIPFLPYGLTTAYRIPHRDLVIQQDPLIPDHLPYTILLIDRSSRGGGVAIIIRDYLSYSTVTLPSSEHEITCIDLFHQSAYFRLCVVYRPPTYSLSKSESLITCLSDMLRLPILSLLSVTSILILFVLIPHLLIDFS